MDTYWLKAAAAAAMVAVVSAAGAQPAGEPRGSIPPGTAADGSRPSEGAITGGSVVPGERSGIPDAVPSTVPTEERIRRCYELSGTLREECLRREQSAGTGSTRPIPVPPPHNPR